MEQIKQVNQTLGESPRLGPFSGQQFVILASIFCLVFGLLNLIFGVDTFWSIFISTWISLTCALLSGEKPYLFWSKIYPSTPTWVRGHAKYFSIQEKKKLGTARVKVTRNKTKRLHPFEDWLDLTTLVSLKRDSYVVGAYLLSQKAIGASNNNLQFIFGYNCTGFHPLFHSSAEIEELANTIVSGYKDIPSGEKFTFRWSSQSNESDVKSSLHERLTNPISPESEFLDWAQFARTKQLISDRVRKNISLNVYTTYTVNFDAEKSGDTIDKFLSRVGNFWQRKFTNSSESLTRKRLTQILNRAVDVSMRHQQILTEMGLSPQPKSELKLWSELCERVGAQEVAVPHRLVFDENGIREEFARGVKLDYLDEKIGALLRSSDAHATSVLLNNGVPCADRKWVCLPHPSDRNKYVGVMVLERKPEIFASTQDQLLFLWKIFDRDPIFDVEVITEVSPADRQLVRSSQQMITRRSRTLDLNVQARKSVDVSAQINVERSVDAQRKLYTGDSPLNLSLVVLVYRDSPEELSAACRTISGFVNQPAELTRETEYAWLIWLQTLLLKQEAILLRPYNRRLTFFASEISGLTNLTQTAIADERGFELIASNGGNPVKIDFSKTKNVLVLGTTGAGKSLLVAPIIAECLAQGMYFLITDLPNDDGTGSYGDLTPYFGGFYYDISKASNNLVQPLDLRKIPESEREERIKAHRNDVNFIVEQLVGAHSLEGFLASTIESLIPLGTKAFYSDPEIKQRFYDAQAGGLDSPAWADTPTLADMERFFSKEYIDLGYEDENVDKALNYIRLRLQYWKNSSIGSAICKPSSFDTDAKLITFALTNLQSGKDAEVFGMSAYIAASRQSLSSPNSAFFMDEASVLLRFDALSRLVGRKCATARKSGCRVILAGQDVLSIAKSEAGEQILQNMPCRLIGRIVPGAAQSFSEILGIPREIIQKNESFRPNIKELYTNWLLDYNNNYMHCRYYPSHAILALTANSREEQIARDRFKEIYPDKFSWVSEFSKYYIDCIKQGKRL